MSTKAAAIAAATATFNNTSASTKSSKVSKTTHTMSKISKVTKRPSATDGPQVASGGKTHKRSRSGCFTCRLRRKKCDEVKPACKACRHLGLACEYKRPTWWNDNSLRKAQKELIKTLIKKTKTIEKQHSKDAAASGRTSGVHTPPGLSRSVPTSATSPGSIGCTRAASEDSQYTDYDAGFDAYHPHIVSQFPYAHDPSTQAHYYGYPPFSSTPYEVDIKTESQTYINNIPTRRDSTISSFSTYQPPHTSLPPLLENDWMQEELYEEAEDMFSDYATAEQQYMDFPTQVPEATTETTINIDLDECDKHLLEHFFSHVMPLIFPIMDVNEFGSTSSKFVIPALQSNKTYLSSCLSTAASHLRSITTDPSEQLNSDIVRHRYATIQQLCEALSLDTDHESILEATLAMITLPCTVGSPNDSDPDIPWHKHFEAATQLIQRLELPDRILKADVTAPGSENSFNMTIASWIDILGATMLGQAPRFADFYRDKHLAGNSLGLAQLMGCDDRIMYLISELSCLSNLQRNKTISEEQLCSHITGLGHQIELHESALASAGSEDTNAISSNGAVRPRILQRNMTLLFSKAARIYLCSLIPGITRHDPTMRNLLNEFTHLLTLIPAGRGGFDRSIVWPLLIAGAHSTRDSVFRTTFAERICLLGENGLTGSFARMNGLLQELWLANEAVDNAVEAGADISAIEGEISWRDVMEGKGWDFLLI